MELIGTQLDLRTIGIEGVDDMDLVELQKPVGLNPIEEWKQIKALHKQWKHWTRILALLKSLQFQQSAQPQLQSNIIPLHSWIADCTLHVRLLTKHLAALIKCSSFWNILGFDDNLTPDNIICATIGELLANIPLDKIFDRMKTHGKNMSSIYQYLGFGENFAKNRNYRRDSKRAISCYLTFCTYPIANPPKNKWGRLVRKKFHKIYNKNKAKYKNILHATRIACISVARKLIREILKTASPVHDKSPRLTGGEIATPS